MSNFVQRIVFFLILVSSLMVTTQSVAGEKIRIACGHYPPWLIYENGSAGGFNVDLINEICEILDLEPEYVYGNFSLAMSRIKSGEIDMMSNLQYREARSKFITYISPACRTNSNVAFYKKAQSDIHIEKYIDLAGKRVAVLEKAKYFPIFDLDTRMVKKAYPSLIECFKAVENGEADVVICASAPGQYVLNQYELNDEICTCSFAYKPHLIPSYLGLSKKSKYSKRVVEFSNALNELKHSGRLDELAMKYHVRLN